jgi:hypothetical protein
VCLPCPPDSVCSAILCCHLQKWWADPKSEVPEMEDVSNQVPGEQVGSQASVRQPASISVAHHVTLHSMVCHNHQRRSPGTIVRAPNGSLSECPMVQETPRAAPVRGDLACHVRCPHLPGICWHHIIHQHLLQLSNVYVRWTPPVQVGHFMYCPPPIPSGPYTIVNLDKNEKVMGPMPWCWQWMAGSSPTLGLASSGRTSSPLLILEGLPAAMMFEVPP